ncbi:MAG: nucleotide sugar dehydrogenase, partial [Candidatus Latescibacterota bacterium]
IAQKRIAELQAGYDRTREASESALRETSVEFSSQPETLKSASIIIIAVPTPIDGHRRPDLKPVLSASRTVGKHLSPGAIVVYESTVYPGLTEEECIPLLEEQSGLKCGKDFWVGYSPERINPGDKVHTLETIVKIVAGQTAEVTDLLAEIYGAVVKAGIHKASSIKVAEAAKVIENTQRDLNIALMNELSLIFDLMGIDTLEVLEAAGTKWNFLPFRPGLVGGHCIGVDPYYLTFKAESLGFHPQIILAGRMINDSMGKRVAQALVKMLIAADCNVKGARIGLLGLTFKENVPDLRNTRVVDIINELQDYGVNVIVHDPHVDQDEAMREYGITVAPVEMMRDLDGVIVAVSHEGFKKTPIQTLLSWCRKSDPILIDIKGVFEPAQASELGFTYWRL